MPRFAIRVVMCLLLVAGTSALGAQSSPTPYGAPVTTDAAKRATAAAMAVARANNWTIAVAIVDGSGVLVYFERMDATPNGSSVIAAEKARSAALFKRPTKSFQDVLTAGGEGLRILAARGRGANRGRASARDRRENRRGDRSVGRDERAGWAGSARGGSSCVDYHIELNSW